MTQSKFQKINNTLFVGDVTGSFAKKLVEALKDDVDQSDVLIINAKLVNGPDICTQIKNFASTFSLLSYKVCVIRNIDTIDPEAQLQVRNMIETVSRAVVFIATCTDAMSILPDLSGRFPTTSVVKPDPDELADFRAKQNAKAAELVTRARAEALFEKIELIPTTPLTASSITKNMITANKIIAQGVDNLRHFKDLIFLAKSLDEIGMKREKWLEEAIRAEALKIMETK